jgi:hypothetical protein
VEDIVFENWDTIYEAGIVPNNYVGDIFGSLGGTPDFGYDPFLWLGRNESANFPLIRPYPYFGEA